jgi:hypothetical protein
MILDYVEEAGVEKSISALTALIHPVAPIITELGFTLADILPVLIKMYQIHKEYAEENDDSE